MTNDISETKSFATIPFPDKSEVPAHVYNEAISIVEAEAFVRDENLF